MRRRAPLLSGLLLAGLGTGCLTGCGGAAAGPVAAAPPGGPLQVSVVISSSGCAMSPSRVADGPAVFTVSNSDGTGVSEVQLTRGGVGLAEVEGVAPGLTQTLALDLSAGTYDLFCPRFQGPTQQVALTVVHTDKPPLTAAQQARADLLDTAVRQYDAYLAAQTAALLTDVEALEKAVAAGDLAAAEAAYAVARSPYERVEPVAESFPDLDQQIDARPADLPTGIGFAGFHRIEQGLWQTGSTAGLDPDAKNLIVDCSVLHARVQTLLLQPAQLADGAVSLLDEIGRTKVTGEEEAWSHLDLVDLQANLDGAREIVTLLTPALPAATSGELDGRFAATYALLATLRQGAGYVSYDHVPAATRRALSASVDAVAAPLSELGADLER